MIEKGSTIVLCLPSKLASIGDLAMDMDINRLQQFAQSMMGRLPQGQILPGMPGNVTGGAVAPMNGRLPVGTSSAAALGQPQARMAVLPGTSAGAAMSASFAKGPATKKQKL